ncbi:MAG: two-component regulator propeller domain-containing protein [Verrucomicrobiota bacterium]
MPQNSVAAIAQSGDGYLWLGTYSGLVRFDGVRFSVYDTDNTPALETVRITALFDDAHNNLWIGHESGELTKLHQGIFESIKVPAVWGGETIAAITTDSEGKLWIGNRLGKVMRLADGLILPNPAKGEDRSITQLIMDRSGRLWVLRNGQLGWVKGDQVMPWLPNGVAPEFRVQAVGSSRSGGVWIVYNAHVRRWDQNDWAVSTEDFSWDTGPGGYVTRLLELQSGTLAVASDGRGVALFQPGKKPQIFNHANKLYSDWVRTLYEDREGNLWAGVGNNGLTAIRPADFTIYLPPDKMGGYSVLAVTPGREGGLWVGSEGAGLYHFDGTTWINYGETNGLLSRYIWSVTEDEAGKVWAGTWGGGLFVGLDGSFHTPPGLEKITTAMTALLAMSNDELWIGTRIGLLHYQQGKTTWYDAQAGLISPDVRCIARGPSGEIWFGMMGGGLGCLRNGKVTQFRKRDGLANDSVLCLQCETNGTLWLGTFGGGVGRYQNGKFSHLSTRDGLANNSISHIADDGQGNYWFASESGIFFASKKQLETFADTQTGIISCTSFGTDDGMASLGCASGFQPAGCRTADGRLWFPTLKGVVSIDPAKLHTNPLPPPVIIERLFCDGDSSSNLLANTGNDSSAILKIFPGHQRLEFRYTALSFTAPQKVRFKYRLEGLEKTWFDAGQNRSATYSYLQPGKYTFRVIACNNSSVWNETGAAQTIVILPHFWQRTGFQAGCYLFALTTVGMTVRFITRRRYRRKLAAVERERALERERARIAKDIHDDLGSSLTRITMLSESARRESNNPEESAKHLDNIYRTSRELTRSMDEIVWAVNPRHDTLNSLATYLLRHAQEFLSPAGIRARSEIPLELPPIPISSEVRHNIFLAYKEALHNVAKHAHASLVNISLALDENSMDITVADNGVGFASERFSSEISSSPDRLAGGNGLENMKKRLEQIHGDCRIESSAGNGTKVIFHLPLAKASREVNAQ